jgi:type IV pilus assembly protein PilQ
MPLAAQDAQVEALDRAKETIASSDETYQMREGEVLDAPVEEAVAAELPELPDEPVFEVPDEEVFLDLPGAEATSTAVAVDAETISVDFPEEDVRDIIRSVAELYELNVVIPDSLAGSVSIKLRDVTWQQVFDVVLEPLSYTYIVDGNIIKIKSLEELAVEPVDTRVFIVDFAKAGEIRGSIEPLIDPASGGKIQVDSRSNALVITERPSRMNDIQEIIETLDRPTEQVMIESKFIEINNRDGESKGVNWQSLAGYGLELGPMTRTYTGENFRNIDADRDNPNQFNGSDDSFNLSNVNGQTSTSLAQSSQSIAQNWYTSIAGRSDTAVFSADAFSMVISALESVDDIELVSNPTVVTMNNMPASINIGEEYPIPSYRYNDERGTFEVSNFEYKPIGINLSVTPQINSAGFINLDIKPEISTRSGVVNFGGASGAEIPIITSRKTSSKVTIKSGYTLAIGGLIQNEVTNEESKVPVLGHIPVMGRLFSSKTRQEDQRNLIVFITAKILSASGATYQDVFDAKTLHEMGVKPRDIPGVKVSDEEMELYDNVLKSRDEVEALQKELQLREQLHMLEGAKQTGENNLEEQSADPDDSQERARRNYQG